eukprot:sb/3479169/
MPEAFTRITFFAFQKVIAGLKFEKKIYTRKAVEGPFLSRWLVGDTKPTFYQVVLRNRLFEMCDTVTPKLILSRYCQGQRCSRAHSDELLLHQTRH